MHYECKLIFGVTIMLINVCELGLYLLYIHLIFFQPEYKSVLKPNCFVQQYIFL